jgi:hypothetical protein
MKHRRLIGMLLSAALIAVSVSCAVDQGASAPNVEQGATTEESGGPLFGATHDARYNELRRRMEGEKTRLDSIRRHNKEVRDSLRLLFKQFKKQNPHVKRRNSPFPICEPKDYDFDMAIVGPQGGTLSVGHHKLVIPQGALTENTLITMERPSSLLIEVEFSPHGTTFLVEPTLELDYSDCYLPADHEYRVAYMSENGKVLEYAVSVDKGGRVQAYIWHFSRYAIAY